MQLKSGVRVNGIRPELLLAVLIADSVFTGAGATLTITSVTDSKHSPGSLHYQGAAFDCRINDLTYDQRAAILATLKRALTTDFDVVAEVDHFHLEYDPKAPF